MVGLGACRTGITRNCRVFDPPAKTIGTAGEQFFVYRTLEGGLHVAQPLGDNLPYDLLVDSGQEILRLQIKTTTTRSGG